MQNLLFYWNNTKEKFFSFLGLFNKNLYKNFKTNPELLDLEINYSGMSRKKNKLSFLLIMKSLCQHKSKIKIQLLDKDSNWAKLYHWVFPIMIILDWTEYHHIMTIMRAIFPKSRDIIKILIAQLKSKVGGQKKNIFVF